jgi:hypothetical protein
MIDWINTVARGGGDRGRDLRDDGRLVEARPAAPRALGMDAASVMSGGGNGGPSPATRRPVVSGLQTPGNKGILATLPTASGRC